MNRAAQFAAGDRPRLLVSVRSAAEAREAIAGGAAVIDVKEPAAGSLGAASTATVADVVAAVAGRRIVTAAQGELCDAAPSLPAGVGLAKLGLARCAGLPDWRDRWGAAVAAWPAGVEPVAVVYADWRAAGAPPPAAVLAASARLGCPAVLVDTFDKRGGDLLAHWPLPQLALFAEQVRRAGQILVLAGSLSPATLERVVPLRPHFVAVRTAACEGGRAGQVVARRVRALAASLVAGREPCPEV